MKLEETRRKDKKIFYNDFYCRTVLVLRIGMSRVLSVERLRSLLSTSWGFTRGPTKFLKDSSMEPSSVNTSRDKNGLISIT